MRDKLGKVGILGGRGNGCAMVENLLINSPFSCKTKPIQDLPNEHNPLYKNVL
jgi:hypothetical protein